jgi:hypothetical protein
MYPYEEALWYLRRQLVLAGYQVSQGLEQGQYIVRWDVKSTRRNSQPRDVAPATEPGDDLFSGLANMQKVAAKLRGK